MNISEITALDAQYYMPVFGTRFPINFVKGEDVYLIDDKGNRYLDFLAGIAVNALGYSDEGFKNTLKEQVDCFLHISNYFYTETQALAAKALAEACAMDKVFFANSGAEANEGAIKLARNYFYKKGQPKSEIITALNSFHGRTMATLAATGQEKYHKPYYPLPPTFVNVAYNDIEAIKAAATENTCAVMLEPVMGEGGVIPAAPGYLKAVREFCDEKGILLIFDEVQCGMGRSGKMLASMQYEVKPDIITLAKALGNGVPVGAFLSTNEIASSFAAGDHGSTFGGNLLATAAALYTVTKINTPEMLAHIEKMGNALHTMLLHLQQAYPAIIKEVRGLGLMQAAALDEAYSAKDIAGKLLESHVIIATAGQNTLRFLPPYIITEEHIKMLKEALNDIFKKIGE